MRKKREQRAPSNKTKTPREATHCNKGKKIKKPWGLTTNQTNQLIRGAGGNN